jgi:sugar phosphate isomerase/epimerase
MNILRNFLCIPTFLFLLGQVGPSLGAETKASAALTNAFFPFCIDWHDSKKRNFEQQSEMLKDLGYSGVGHIWLDKVEERLMALDADKLQLYQLTVMVDLKPDKPTLDPRLKQVISLLKGRGTQILLLLNGMKPSDPAGDDKAVAVVREIAELCQASGLQVLLYPHTDFWLERFEDAMRLEKKVARPNVGTMFNLCHWLRVSKDRNYRALLEAGKDRLFAVSINGADERDENPGWGRYIQPLGRGSFDVLALLRTLKEMGFTGPVGLQCYGISGDARDQLADSMKAWREYCRKLSQ